jgi:hypothetical protein
MAAARLSVAAGPAFELHAGGTQHSIAYRTVPARRGGPLRAPAEHDDDFDLPDRATGEIRRSL